MSGAKGLFPIEATGIVHGLPYAVLANPMGFRCGYVMVPKAHPLYGAMPSARADGLPEFDDEFSHERTIDGLIKVHGGLTFAGSRPYAALVGGWWLGFSCDGHADGYDVTIGEVPHSLTVGGGYPYPPRTREYVEAECRELARQLAGFEVPDPRTDPRVRQVLDRLGVAA